MCQQFTPQLSISSKTQFLMVSGLVAMTREEEDRHCEPALAGAAIQEKHLNHRIFVNFFWIASLALRRPTRHDVFLRGNLKTKIIVDDAENRGLQ